MKTKNREFLSEEAGKRLVSMLERFSQVREVVPWLRPGQSHSALRRTAARLRSGAIRGLDPHITPSALAAAIEASVAQEELVKSVALEMMEYRRMWEEITAQEEAERARGIVAGFHRLKKSPQAADPASPVAEKVRHLHRSRRNELGRSRKRKKK